MTKRFKKNLLLVVKLTLAAALLAWVYRKEDWSQFANDVKQANAWLLAAAFAAYVVSLATIAVRLQFLLRVQGIHIRMWELVRLTFLGQLFNSVVPGVVGGDLVKAFYVAKHTPHKAAAMVTVFVDRLTGLAALVLQAIGMLAVVLAMGMDTLENLWQAAIAAVSAVGALAVMSAFLFSSRLRKLFHLQKLYSRLSVAHHFALAGDAARKFRQHLGLLLWAVVMTIAAQALWIAGVALAGASLSIEVAWHSYFIYIPLIYIIGSVPITPGGLGVVEGLYAGFFVGVERITRLAAVARALDILRGLPGLLVVITGTKLPKAEQLEAELASEEPD